MARKPDPKPEIVDANIDEEAFNNAAKSLNELSLTQSAAKENAQAVAEQLGYEGAISADSLESEIRFYQKRSVEAVLELGKRLLIMKELTPHGEFKECIDRLGIAYRMAAKFMAATLKFSKVNSNSLLKSAGTQTKLLELVVLDDAEIEALDSGETVRGLTLDEIETMSVSELKSALRDTKADLEASRKLHSSKDEKVNKLEEALHKKRIQKISPDETGKQIRAEASQIAYAAEAEIRGNLRLAFQELAAHTEDSQISHTEFMTGLVCQVELALNQLRGDFLLSCQPDSDTTPAFLRPGAEEEVAALTDKQRLEAGWVKDENGNWQPGN